MMYINKRKTLFPLNKYLSIIILVLSCISQESLGTIGFYPVVDYLLWKPQEDGLQYAIAKREDSILEVQKPDFCWSSGVRAGVGFNGYEGWDIKGVWTHLRAHAYAEKASDMAGNMVLTPLNMINDPVLYTGVGAASRVNFAYDTLDVEVGRGWYRCGGVVVNAHLGAKWARINQAHNILYVGVNDADTQAKVSRINNFSGVGPSINVQAIWPVGRGISLCAEASEAFLAGKVCTAAASGINTAQLAPLPTIINKASSVRFMSRLLLGVGWGQSLYNDCYDIYLRAGYEMQWWPRQWNACASTAQAQSGLQQGGDLSLQGLVLTCGLYF